MNKCICCKIARGDGCGFQKIIVNMEGGWVLNHFRGEVEKDETGKETMKGTYLGRLVLGTKCHRTDWDALCFKEAMTVGLNIQRINWSLRQYWSKNYPNDPIELVHVDYLNETPFIKHLGGEELLEGLHVHMHLLTRTRGIGKALGYCKDKIGFHLEDNVDKFPSDYRDLTKDDDRVVDLMNFLNKSLGI